MKEEKKDYQYVFRVYEKKGDKEYDFESVVVNNVLEEEGYMKAKRKMEFICMDENMYFEFDSVNEYHVPYCVIDGGCELDPIFAAVHQIAVNKFIAKLDIVRRAFQNEDFEVVEGELFDLERNLYFSRFVCLLNDREYYSLQSQVDEYWWKLRDEKNGEIKRRN